MIYKDLLPENSDCAHRTVRFEHNINQTTGRHEIFVECRSCNDTAVDISPLDGD